MRDSQDLLDRQLEQLGRAVLKSGGSIKTDAARQKAEAEYEKFD